MNDQYTLIQNRLDESFNLQETRNYTLVIQFNESEFAYCILDLRRNKYIVLQHFKKAERGGAIPKSKSPFQDFLNHLVTDMPWLKNGYKSVLLAYEGKHSTLIPTPLFDPSVRDSYLQFNFQPGEEEQTFSDHLVPFDAHLVYSMPSSTVVALQHHFPTVRVHHLTSVFIASIWINYKNRINSMRVFINLREKFFDLVLFDGRQMSYCNAFHYANAEDVAYYLIFVLEQLNINPEGVSAVLLGKAERNTPLFELLSRYIRHIEFGRRNESYKYSYGINQISPHAYYPLLNFHSCGL